MVSAPDRALSESSLPWTVVWAAAAASSGEGAGRVAQGVDHRCHEVKVFLAQGGGVRRHLERLPAYALAGC